MERNTSVLFGLLVLVGCVHQTDSGESEEKAANYGLDETGAPTDRGSEDACDAYAAFAVEMYETSQAAGCDFENDSEWHNDRQAHFDYCMRVSVDEVREISSRRAQAIRRCVCSSNSDCGDDVCVDNQCVPRGEPGDSCDGSDDSWDSEGDDCRSGVCEWSYLWGWVCQ